jgi:sugar/nucleoside kinase (ribokinase family)
MTKEGKVINDLKHHQKLIAFGYGSKIIPEEVAFFYGGGGVNTSISFSKLGLHTAAILNIGQEGTGSLVVRELEAANVSCIHVTRDPKNHTAMSMVVSLDGDDHTMFLYRGSNNFIHVPDWRDVHTKWFYVSSLTGESAELIPEIFSYARAHNIKIAWNPGSEQLACGFSDLETYLEETDILILNKDEACCLLRSKGIKSDFADTKIVTNLLKETTRGVVVVTDGKEGSYVTSEEKSYHEPAHKAKTVETTGAGDSFGSTFVAARIKGYGTKYSMKLAAENAAGVVGQLGAQNGLMTFEELRAKIGVGGIDAKE